eukprot:486358_1
MKDELKRSIIDKHVSQKKKIRIACINKREFTTIFKFGMKQVFGMVHWIKETPRSNCQQLQWRVYLVMHACVKETQTMKYGVDGWEMKYIFADKLGDIVMGARDITLQKVAGDKG